MKLSSGLLAFLFSFAFPLSFAAAADFYLYHPQTYTPPSTIVVAQTVPQTYAYPVTHLAAQYVPSMPNTGFEPLTATAFAFAAVLLIGAGIFVLPYVQRTLASTFR